jgi:hypothetical protein
MRKARRARCEVVLPEVILRRVRATAAVLGSTSTEVAIAGCRLFCTFVLRELSVTSSPASTWKKGGPQWEVNELVKVLASRFGSRRRS